jgi:hypothetical protein
MSKSLLLVAVFAMACGAAPPKTIEVSTELPAGVQLATAIARDAWCAVADRTHWCPELVEAGGDASIVVREYPGACTDDTPEGTNCSGGRNHDGVAIYISPLVSEEPGEKLAGVVTHEFGHFGIDGHIARSELMRWFFPGGPETIPATVDSSAVAGWCQQQGC